MIRYDTRGFGRTETEDVEFSDHADAAAVLDHFGADSASVIGQSRGGGIALDLAIDRPHRVDALVSVAGGVGGYEAELPEGVEAPPWDEMERVWEAKDWEALAELETKVWVDGWGQPSDRVDSGLREKVHGWILAAMQAEKPWGKPQQLDPPAADRLGNLRSPLWSDRQVDEPAAVSRSATSRLGAEARVVEFPRVAHMIQLESRSAPRCAGVPRGLRFEAALSSSIF